MKTGFHFSIILVFVLLFSGCKRDEDIVPEKPDEHVSVKLTIHYAVDALPLIFDSLIYTTNAGNAYEVTHLEYYISNITFHSTTGKEFTSKKTVYINAQTLSTNTIAIDNVPKGEYDQLTFNIGLDTASNISFSLPNTSENINMAWPAYMGGGYHFMKFEGNYVYLTNNIGFTIHLGQNSSLVYCTINKSFVIDKPDSALKLSMNLNEWFRSPILYDLNVDGYAIMGDALARSKIAANGIDVFTME